MPPATATDPSPRKATVCPAGNHPAVTVALIDLGTHPETYQGRASDARRVAIAWELPREIRPDGSPFVLARDFTLSFAESARLRQFVESWRNARFADGEEFDLASLLGRPGLVNVVHRRTARGAAVPQVVSVSSLPRGMTPPARSLGPLLYVADPSSPLPAAGWLPFLYGEPMADIILRSREFGAG